jgi:hypothetical protein
MTYMQDLEQKLREWLDSFGEGDVSKDQFIAFLKQSHLDSYHNGQKAGPRSAPQSNSQSNGQGAPSGRREWSNKKRSARNAPSYRANSSQ